MLFSDPEVLALARRVHELSNDLRSIELLRAPSLHDIVKAPILEDWSVGLRHEPALLGKVDGHPLVGPGRIVTSPVFYLDERAGFARTMSRWYRLGAKSRD